MLIFNRKVIAILKLRYQGYLPRELNPSWMTKSDYKCPVNSFYNSEVRSQQSEIKRLVKSE